MVHTFNCEIRAIIFLLVGGRDKTFGIRKLRVFRDSTLPFVTFFVLFFFYLISPMFSREVGSNYRSRKKEVLAGLACE